MLKNDPIIGINNLVQYNRIAKNKLLPFFKKLNGVPIERIGAAMNKVKESLDLLNSALKSSVDTDSFINEMLSKSNTFNEEESTIYEWKEHVLEFIKLVISKNIYSKINDNISPITFANFVDDSFIFNVDVDYDGDLLSEVEKVIGPDLRFIDFDVIDWEIYIIPTERFINMYSSELKSRY